MSQLPRREPISPSLGIDFSEHEALTSNISTSSREPAQYEQIQRETTSSVVSVSANQYKLSSNTNDELCTACRNITVEELLSEDGYSHNHEADVRITCRLCLILRDMEPGYFSAGNYWISRNTPMKLIIRKRTAVMGTEEFILGLSNFADYDSTRVTISVHLGEGDIAFGIPNLRCASSSGSTSTLDIVKGWHQHCILHHGCNAPIFHSPDSALGHHGFYPTRLLDVLAFGAASQDLRLVVSPTPGQLYATLSHCWGPQSGNIYRTTTSNLASRLKRISWDDIPQTFRDAVTVCRHLSIRFLWIDSCCIVQDSDSDWKHESSTMAEVYSGSTITISADWSSGPDFGCFHPHENPEPTASQQPVSLTHTLPSGRKRKVYFCPPKDVANLEMLDDTILSSRAWAVQERLLSPRIVHFTRSQALWECRESFASEELVSVKHNWPKPKFIRNVQLWNVPGLIIDMWYTWVLKKYTATELTVPTDRLVAISAIAKVFHQRLGMRYLAGFWEEYWTFVPALTWYRVASSVESSKPSKYIAPSWSWASINSHVKWLVRNGDHSVTRHARFEKAKVACEADPFGQVSSGYIRLYGPYLRSYTLQKLRMLTDDTENGPSEVKIHLDFAVEEEIYRLLILCSNKLQQTTTLYALLLVPSQSSVGRYERRGIVEIVYLGKEVPVSTLTTKPKSVVIV